MPSKRESISLTSCPQPPQGPLVPHQVLLVLPFELVDEVVDHPVVKVLPTKVSVSCRGLHLKDAAAKIKDQHVTLPLTLLLVKAIGNGRCCGLVDDPQDVESCDHASVLGGLPLAVVEVGWHGDHRLSDLGAQVRLGSLLHLDEHHGADLLRGESLLLALVLHPQPGKTVLLDNLEGPVL